jgi:E3 ubiquitin-protein ligase SHPRH
LKENGIRCLRIDQKSKNESAANVFRTNPDILVLLLHGCVIVSSILISMLNFLNVIRERENAGLNLTCASRVFLLESVVQHSFEIQGTYGPVKQVEN